MIKELKRSEIKEEDKWDLTKIYQKEEDWEKDFQEVSKEIPKIEKYKSHINDSSKSLLNYLNDYFSIDRKLSKLYYYANLHHDEDTTNTKYQELLGRVENLLTEYQEITSFDNSEMMKTSYETIKKYIEAEKGLQVYAHYLDNYYRFQDHILTEEQDQIISSFSKALGSSHDIYSALTNADLSFGSITTEDGEEIELTDSNYITYMTSNNRKIREEAFKKVMNTYKAYENTFASIYSNHVEVAVQSAKVRRYQSALQASLFKDNVEEKVYNTMIDTVSKNLAIAYNYFSMKKDVLGLKEFHNYDVYAELVPKKNDEKYTFAEAKEIVLKALEPLGEDYHKHLLRAFNEHWIDIYHNKGKRGGAYSSGFYDIPPYILLNFEGRLNDVSTLAHELGHSMHSLYSWEHNPYEKSSYRIFVAEVASTVNELLLSKYLLKNSKDKEEKLQILNKLLELFKGTIIRQTMFAEFEKITHEARENKEVLTHEFLNNKYYELNEKYFGKDVTLDDEIRYEWMRIPHFYYNFYVYKYVIGLSSACYIVQALLNNKPNAKENYLKFLSLGDSMYPIEELKVAGVDVTKKEVLEAAMKMFKDTIEEFKKERGGEYER